MNGKLRDLTRPVRVLYVSTYIPRKCGIATFTKDLTNAINLLNPRELAGIVAMDNKISEGLNYPHEVKYRIRQGVRGDYGQVVDYVNKSGEVDLVVIQHEFGIFGGRDGEMVMELVDKIEKPIVTTFHTMLAKPTVRMRKIVRKIGEKSRYVVVMLEASREMLASVYGVEKRKIIVIPHGVPDFPRMGEGRKKFGMAGKVVMSSINLISEAKGIEYVIGALPEIIKQVPNLMYLVVGETHPVVKLTEGEKYRRKLERLVKDLDLGKSVKFVNKYLPLAKLVTYVGASDIYITPYLDPQQASSGSLAYAIGAGKACVSTPYLYAQEMFTLGCGKMVPFRDSSAIARAVLELWGDKQGRVECEEKAYQLGRTMTWHNVGHLYYHLFHYALS